MSEPPPPVICPWCRGRQPSQPICAQCGGPFVIGNRYSLKRSLGWSPLGGTYLIADAASDAPAVLEMLRLEAALPDSSMKRIIAAGQSLREIDHTGVPRLFDAFLLQDRERFYCQVREMKTGRSLRQLVAQGAPLGEKEAREALIAALRVLDYLATRRPPLVHGNIRPETVLRLGPGRVALVELGQIRALIVEEMGGQGLSVWGDYGYTPLEQVAGIRLPASDLYALGVTLIVCMTGVSPMDLPWERLRLMFRRRLRVTPGFAEVLDRLVAPELGERYGSPRAVLCDLERLGLGAYEADEPMWYLRVDKAEQGPLGTRALLQSPELHPASQIRRDTGTRAETPEALVAELGAQLSAESGETEATRRLGALRRRLVRRRCGQIGLLCATGGLVATVAGGLLETPISIPPAALAYGPLSFAGAAVLFSLIASGRRIGGIGSSQRAPWSRVQTVRLLTVLLAVATGAGWAWERWDAARVRAELPAGLAEPVAITTAEGVTVLARDAKQDDGLTTLLLEEKGGRAAMKLSRPVAVPELAEAALAAFSPAAGYLSLVNRACGVTIYRLTGGKASLMHHLPPPPRAANESPGAVPPCGSALAVADSGRLVAVAAAGAIHLRALASEGIAPTIETAGAVRALAFGPDQHQELAGIVGKERVYGVLRQSVVVWDLRTGEERFRARCGSCSRVAFGAFADRVLLAVAGGDAAAIVWPRAVDGTFRARGRSYYRLDAPAAALALGAHRLYVADARGLAAWDLGQFPDR
ncbi:MAG: hypothetical protein HYV63_15350 [Candidatus Schekmanbacteria bacterium]|nr:hypothetical protein [Candidatus Schekmanbacteria bacterium]